MGHWGGHPKTANGKRVTCDGERARRQDPTDSNAGDNHWKNVQQTTDDMQHAFGKMQQTTHSVQHTTSGQHEPCSGQYAANNNHM
jgi:hypothetical protein